MKVILIFDDAKETRLRWYELQDHLVDALRCNERISIAFCHPDAGEVFEASVGEKKDGM